MKLSFACRFLVCFLELRYDSTIFNCRCDSKLGLAIRDISEEIPENLATTSLRKLIDEDYVFKFSKSAYFLPYNNLEFLNSLVPVLIILKKNEGDRHVSL